MDWFTSDTHAYHTNICRGVSSWNEGYRDFDNVDQMTDLMANNINACVQANDTLYHLGDWSFGGIKNVAKFREKINCKNIHLIFGNHDHHIEKNDYLRKLFVRTDYLRQIHSEGQRITLCHFAMRIWDKSHHQAWHLYGHSHGSLPDDIRLRSIDVGMDTQYTIDDVFDGWENPWTARTRRGIVLRGTGKLHNQVDFPHSIMVHDYMRPFNMEELRSIMSYKRPTSVDHHDSETN